MRIRLVFGALFATTLIGGCTDARIGVPSELISTTERLELKGVGGWQDGRLRLGASEGRFSRRATQTTLLNAFRSNAGTGRFDIGGAEFGGQVAGECAFEEREIDIKVAVVPDGRLTYRCRFHRNGEAIAGGLLLAEVPRGSGVLAGRSRAGELRMGDLSLAIRPIHRFAGGGLPTDLPLGYAFDVDGRQIGAVDLNGTTKTIYVPTHAGPQRDAVLLASLALSVFWDPGA